MKEYKKVSTTGNTIRLRDEYGWILKIKYRKSLNDLIIEQYHQEHKVNNRFVYIRSNEVKELYNLLNEKENSKQ